MYNQQDFRVWHAIPFRSKKSIILYAMGECSTMQPSVDASTGMLQSDVLFGPDHTINASNVLPILMVKCNLQCTPLACHVCAQLQLIHLGGLRLLHTYTYTVTCNSNHSLHFIGKAVYHSQYYMYTVMHTVWYTLTH